MRHSRSPDFYVILGVTPTATADEIRSAYRIRAKILHPDRFDPRRQPEEWRKANEMLAQLNEAYSVLQDPGERRNYDRAKPAQRPEVNPKPATTQAASSKPQPASRPRRSRPSSTAAEFTGGETDFDALPADMKQTFRHWQSGSGPGTPKFKVSLGSPAWNYASLLLAPAWLWYMAADARGARWETGKLILYVLLTVAVALIVVHNALRVIRWNRCVLKPYLYLTPLYFIETRFDRVRIWPIWELKDLSLVHRLKDGAYQDSAVRLDFDRASLTFTLDSRSAVENFGELLSGFHDRARDAFTRGDIEYLRDNDHLYDIPRGKRATEREIAPDVRYTLAAVGAVAGLACALVADVSNRQYASRPPVRHSYPQAIAAEGNRTSSVLDDLERLERNLAAPVAPELVLPANGATTRFHTSPAVAPLQIVTRGSEHHLVKVTRWDTDDAVATVFIRAGQTVEVQMPLGFLPHQVRNRTPLVRTRFPLRT